MVALYLLNRWEGREECRVDLYQARSQLVVMYKFQTVSFEQTER
jgi:hypothetical protein